MQDSLAKTLAAKLTISVAQVYERFKTVIQTKGGPRRVFQVTVEREGGKRPLVARWGAVPLARSREAPLRAQPRPPRDRRAELAVRLLANTCELCGSRVDVEAHVERCLKDLERDGRADTPWARTMVAKRREDAGGLQDLPSDDPRRTTR